MRQIFSVAMLLRESFGFHEEADAIEQAVRRVWRAGWRTPDLREPGGREVSTTALTDRVVDEILGGAGTARA